MALETIAGQTTIKDCDGLTAGTATIHENQPFQHQWANSSINDKRHHNAIDKTFRHVLPSS